MILEKKLVNKWRALRTRGDVSEIAKLSGKTTVTVRKALREGICSDELLSIIGTYYQARIELIKQYI